MEPRKMGNGHLKKCTQFYKGSTGFYTRLNSHFVNVDFAYVSFQFKLKKCVTRDFETIIANFLSQIKSNNTFYNQKICKRITMDINRNRSHVFFRNTAFLIK